MRPLALLPSLALLAVLAFLWAPEGATAQEDCPKRAFLAYDGLFYASTAIPASATLAAGEALGGGTLDQPTDQSGCKRERIDVEVFRLGDLDPKVAVAVEGRPGEALVLGARCSGYEGAERWDCLLAPLELGGVRYTGSRYPAEPLPQGALTLRESLGEAELGGEGVTVAAIEGVDPAVAVGIEGRPSEAFLAPGVCPYERFANDEAQNDLLRCLQGPVWLAFDPPGARVGEGVTAGADRSVRPELAGATVSLVRLREATDALPRDLSGAITVATFEPGGSALQFKIPDLEEGLYEAVVTCEACATAFGGRTRFPAGSLIVLEKKGDAGARIVFLVVGGLVIVLAFAAIVVWRKGWHRRRFRDVDGDGDAGAQ